MVSRGSAVRSGRGDVAQSLGPDVVRQRARGGEWAQMALPGGKLATARQGVGVRLKLLPRSGGVMTAYFPELAALAALGWQLRAVLS